VRSSVGDPSLMMLPCLSRSSSLLFLLGDGEKKSISMIGGSILLLWGKSISRWWGWFSITSDVERGKKVLGIE